MTSIYDALAAMAIFIAQVGGVEVPDEPLPSLYFVSEEQMGGLFVGAAAYMCEVCRKASDYDERHAEILLTDEPVIIIKKKYDAGTKAGYSILLHEMVHWMQDHTSMGNDAECMNATEREAYRIQDRWLQEQGSSLEEEFGWTEDDTDRASECPWPAR